MEVILYVCVGMYVGSEGVTVDAGRCVWSVLVVEEVQYCSLLYLSGEPGITLDRPAPAQGSHRAMRGRAGHLPRTRS